MHAHAPMAMNADTLYTVSMSYHFERLLRISTKALETMSMPALCKSLAR